MNQGMFKLDSSLSDIRKKLTLYGHMPQIYQHFFKCILLYRALEVASHTLQISKSKGNSRNLLRTFTLRCKPERFILAVTIFSNISHWNTTYLKKRVRYGLIDAILIQKSEMKLQLRLFKSTITTSDQFRPYFYKEQTVLGCRNLFQTKFFEGKCTGSCLID